MLSLPRWAFLLLCVALVLPAQSAWAGLFDDDEARKQVAALRQELLQSVEALGKRVDGATQNQLDFANQAEALRADVARLMGQIEVLTNSLETAHKRQQDFYVDLDTRLRKLEGAVSTPAAETGSATPVVAARSDPQAEMRDFEAALGLSSAGKFKEAQAAFEGFIATHPKSPRLPNAHYWLGHSHYEQKHYDQAANVFSRVASTWPNEPKAPDALLAQANALVGAKDVKAAIKVLETLVEKYPTSSASETARARLKSLAPKKQR
jgi:tol-pal system protein YbgF